jgi:WD40 repeat protein
MENVRDVCCVAFDPAGRTLASAGADETIKLWESATGRLLHTLSNDGIPVSIAFDPVGRTLAASSETGVSLWSMDQARIIRNLEMDPNSRELSVAFDLTGRILAVAGGASIQLWDVAGGLLLRTIATQAALFSIAFDPEGSVIASIGVSGTVDLWNIESGTLIRSLEGHASAATSVRYSATHRLIATKGWDHAVRLWSAVEYGCVAVIPELQSEWPPSGLAFHPHLPLLATVGSDPDTPEEARDRLIHIWEYEPAVLLGRATSGAVAYTSAKIVLVGDSGVGKTGLGWRLKHGAFKEHPSTHGQQFWLLDQLGGKRADGAQCEAILWDLAGQPDYRLIHALFLDDADLALVLFDPTRRDDPFQGIEFWLEQLRSCPAILVAARADRGSVHISAEEIEEFCRRHRIRAYLSTSAFTGQGIDVLTRTARSLIPWDNKPATVTTETFKRIRDHVLELKESGNHESVLFTFHDLRERLQKSDSDWTFTDGEMSTAIGHLANHGYISKLKTSQGEQRILLAPELINNLAASFVNEARRQSKGLGSLEEYRLLSDGYRFLELETLHTRERDILLDSAALLFLEHNICFRETDPLTTQTYLVFPALINLKRPTVDDDKPLEDGVTYSVTGSVENVYASLVVLLGYTHTFTRTSQVKNQARYEVGNGLVCAFRQEEVSQTELQFVLSFGADVTAPIRMLFQSLFESFLARRNLTVVRFLPVACPNGHAMNRVVVRERLAAGATFAFCSRCGQRVILPKADQPIQLTSQQAAEVETQHQAADQRSRFEQAVFRWNSYVTEQKIAAPECLISYAWGDPEQERWVEHNLASDLLKAGIKVVLDRWENRRIGASVSRFVERAGKSERVIIVGTPRYRAKFEKGDPVRPYVIVAESELIGARLLGTEAEKQTVIPVLLEGDPKNSLPLLLQGRVYADFRAVETYFDAVFDLILSLYSIPAHHPVAAELRNLLSGEGPFTRT